MPNRDEVREFLVGLPDDQLVEILTDVEATRRGRDDVDPQERPPLGSANRELVASWLADRHLKTDPGISEVWYLPAGAPPTEIRLLEVNKSLNLPTDDQEPLSAVDFGLDVDDLNYVLFVADVTPSQIDMARQGQLRLPRGWSLEGSQIFRRPSR